LKLDFLYAGAQEGQRHEPLTGAEAYVLAMSLMREAAGDAWILACGAPVLPTLGFADSFRTGADIAFEVDPDPRQDYVRWQARSTAARSWQNGLWWWNDPDQLIVREPFEESQVTGAVAANVVSGGTWMLGDDLASMDPGRLSRALDRELVELRGQFAKPAAPLAYLSGPDISPVAEWTTPDDEVPIWWTLEGGVVVLLNLSESTVQVKSPGGREVFSGDEVAAGEVRTLLPGAGEVWFPE
ncbi:MAG: hypothetical protein QGG40_21780, partial [Myxococcota bacterium]|nr:hypothetical protein [Myxococcota bacterium]